MNLLVFSFTHLFGLPWIRLLRKFSMVLPLDQCFREFRWFLVHGVWVNRPSKGPGRGLSTHHLIQFVVACV